MKSFPTLKPPISARGLDRRYVRSSFEVTHLLPIRLRPQLCFPHRKWKGRPGEGSRRERIKRPLVAFP